MRLVQVQTNQSKKINHGKRLKYSLLFMLLVLLLVGTLNFFRPLPAPQVSLNIPKPPEPQKIEQDWPASGDAMIGSTDSRTVFYNSLPDKEVATASMAKVITALCVLDKSPLKLKESGPVMTMNEQDLKLLQDEYDHNGSHLEISLGEKLTQYQMLQAIMLPSANNIANSLAIRTFGSLEKYQQYANQFVQKNGMTKTKIGPDASGLDPSTTSTLHDLTILARLASENPVLMEIAGTDHAFFETAGTVYNRNTRLTNGILSGLKTGMNDQNSGAFLFTSRSQTEAGVKTLVGVVANSNGSEGAVRAAEQLVISTIDDIKNVDLLEDRQKIGVVTTEWGSRSDVLLAQKTSISRWNNEKIYVENKIDRIVPGESEEIGSVIYRTSGDRTNAGLVLDKPLSKPSLWWRISTFR